MAVAAALSRSRDRELAAVARADAVDDECRRLEHIIHGADARHVALSERLARPARGAAYSAAARGTLVALEQLAGQNPLCALIVPPGSDPSGYAAHFHLASARRAGPLILIDCASAEEQQPERWQDEEKSPLNLADGGTLVLLGLLALPLSTQENVAIALSRRAAHSPRSSILPPGVIVTIPRAASELVQQGKLSATLARWFDGAAVRLPRLSERAEDLRSLALDVLARKSLELSREPLGIDTAALRLIVEHAFPNNEAELWDLLGRAAQLAEGPVLRKTDLEALGFKPEVSEPAPDFTPPPATVTTRRRPSRRAPRSR
ncbi:MAG: hypothetical protein QM756_16200 [Polyangiaceae bacterium]